MKRRHFIYGSLAATATSVFGEESKKSLLLGYDNFAVRRDGLEGQGTHRLCRKAQG